MRFVLCILLVAWPPSFAFAAKGTMRLSEAQEAAAKGDDAAAVAMTTDRQTCLNGCANQGHNKEQCTNTCRPGLCHPGAEQPYCIAK
jgi:hypothetical protein